MKILNYPVQVNYIFFLFLVKITALKKCIKEILREGTTVSDVMLSYQWNSKEKVTELRNYLVAKGHMSVWMDETKVEDKLNDQIAEGVSNSKIVVLCLSRDYEESTTFQKEVKYARYKMKKIFYTKTESSFIPKSEMSEAHLYDLEKNEEMEKLRDAIKLQL